MRDATSSGSFGSVTQLLLDDKHHRRAASKKRPSQPAPRQPEEDATLRACTSPLLQLCTCSETARAGNDGRHDDAGPPTPSSSSSLAGAEHQQFDASSSDSQRRKCDDTPTVPRPAGGWDAALFAVCACPGNHEKEEDAAVPALF